MDICEYERYIGVAFFIAAAFLLLLQLWRGFEKTLIVVTIGFAVASVLFGLVRICTLTQFLMRVLSTL